MAGAGHNTFNLPTDVGFAPNGDFYVTDGYASARVQREVRRAGFRSACGVRDAFSHPGDNRWLLDAIGVVGEVDVNEVDGVTYVEIWADDDPDALGLLIGKRGNTLESIQELVRIVVHRVRREVVHPCVLVVLLERLDVGRDRGADLLWRGHGG